MNKYYKLTNLLILIALVFGSFFVWKEKTNSPTPALKLVTAEGNAEHLKTVELYGYLSNLEAYGMDENFHLKENQAKYLSDQPILKRVDNSLDPLINQLIEDYRSFMRGKYPSSKNYISTDDFIVYVAPTTDIYWKDTKMDELVIAILNKETKEEEKFTLSLNNPDSYYDLDTIHLNYPKVSLVLTEHRKNEQGKYAIYEFNIEEPEVGLTEVYDFTEKVSKDGNYQVEKVSDKTSRWIPFKTIRDGNKSDESAMASDEQNEELIDSEIEEEDELVNEEEEEEEEVEMVTELASYFVYDIEENKIIDIPLFETDTLLLIDQNIIYVAENLGQTLHFYEMNLEKEELEKLGEVQLKSVSISQFDDAYPYDQSFTPNLTVFNGKLYAFGQEEVKGSYLPVFEIVDLKSLETLFLGRLDRLEDASDKKVNIDLINYQLNEVKN